MLLNFTYCNFQLCITQDHKHLAHIRDTLTHTYVVYVGPEQVSLVLELPHNKIRLPQKLTKQAPGNCNPHIHSLALRP